MNMQRKLLAAVLVLLFVAGFVGAAFAKGTPGEKLPKIVIDNKTVQLGDVLEAQNVEYVFKVKNAGDAELQIINVRPG